jgi:hypothetical protein
VLAVLNGFGLVKLQPKAAAYAADIVAVLIALERWRPWRDELGANCDGDLPRSPVTAE